MISTEELLVVVLVLVIAWSCARILDVVLDLVEDEDDQ